MTIVHAWLRQFILFFGVGLVATGLHYCVMVFLVAVVGMFSVAAAACGYVAGAVLSYFLNYRFTFQSSEPRSATFIKFSLVACAGLLLNSGLVALFVTQMGVHYLVSQMCATALILCWNFAINRIWTFKES
jgi:putative flippase GtrA